MAGTSFVVYITCRRSAVASGPELGDNPVLFTKRSGLSADASGLGLGEEPVLFTKHRRERGGEILL